MVGFPGFALVDLGFCFSNPGWSRICDPSALTLGAGITGLGHHTSLCLLLFQDYMYVSSFIVCSRVGEFSCLCVLVVGNDTVVNM